MNRLAFVTSRSLSRLASSPSSSAKFNPFLFSATTASEPSNFAPIQPAIAPPIPPSTDKGPLKLPAFERVSLYNFPDLNRIRYQAPSLDNSTEEKVDPASKEEVKAPSFLPPIPVLAAPRLLTIRRKKMKKHKRKKRFDRDWAKYQKYHREKKLKAEREYEKRMKAYLAELAAFSPEKYVEEVMEGAARQWQTELAPTGRKLYPHWSRLMTIEELYGLPKSDFIDKRAGLPGEEETAKISQLKEDYRKQFREQLPSLVKANKKK